MIIYNIATYPVWHIPYIYFSAFVFKPVIRELIMCNYNVYFKNLNSAFKYSPFCISNFPVNILALYYVCFSYFFVHRLCSFPYDYKNEAAFSLPASPQVFKDQGQILFSPASGQLRRGHQTEPRIRVFKSFWSLRNFGICLI